MTAKKDGIRDLQIHIDGLRVELEQAEAKLQALKSCPEERNAPNGVQDPDFTNGANHEGRTRSEDDCEHHVAKERLRWEGSNHSMTKEQLERYSRQILLHSFGPQAQDRLCKGSVLIIGAGGLGCPAAIYLASAGVGTIGIVDKDVVELSNLHRQILHTEKKVGLHKADSAAEACRAINSLIQVKVYKEGFTPENALDIVREYDVVIDATDNAPSRYLISDACCVLSKSLVSGAAIGTDGQLNVYSYNNGPCYRCLFPVPPAAENCSRCSDAGVLGPVPGLIGVLQAIETLKILSGTGIVMSQKMLLVDTLSGRFTSVKIRSKQPNCASCGENPSISAENLSRFDYRKFTGQDYNDSASESLNLLSEDQRLSAQQFLKESQSGLILDVRPQIQYDAIHLPGSLHVPLDENHVEKFEASVQNKLEDLQQPLYVMCRRGNNSQIAVSVLQNKFNIRTLDLEGGLQSLASFEPSLPCL